MSPLWVLVGDPVDLLCINR